MNCHECYDYIDAYIDNELNVAAAIVVNGREVAALVYQRRLHIINLFIWPLESGRNTAAESFTKDGYDVSRWERDGFEFWAVSDVSAEDLRAFAGLEMQQS